MMLPDPQEPPKGLKGFFQSLSPLQQGGVVLGGLAALSIAVTPLIFRDSSGGKLTGSAFKTAKDGVFAPKDGPRTLPPWLHKNATLDTASSPLPVPGDAAPPPDASPGLGAAGATASGGTASSYAPPPPGATGAGAGGSAAGGTPSRPGGFPAGDDGLGKARPFAGRDVRGAVVMPKLQDNGSWHSLFHGGSVDDMAPRGGTGGASSAASASNAGASDGAPPPDAAGTPPPQARQQGSTRGEETATGSGSGGSGAGGPAGGAGAPPSCQDSAQGGQDKMNALGDQYQNLATERHNRGCRGTTCVPLPQTYYVDKNTGRKIYYCDEPVHANYCACVKLACRIVNICGQIDQENCSQQTACNGGSPANCTKMECRLDF
jgi:hypothetical protein